MAGLLEISVDHEGIRALEELHERLNRSPKPVLEEVAEGLAALLRQHIDAGDFPPLSPVTLEIRRRRGQTGTSPLIDMGAMVGSIRSRATKDVAIASVGWPAQRIDAGFTTGEKSAIPGKEVPARRFVFFRDEDLDPFQDKIAEFLLGDIP